MTPEQILHAALNPAEGALTITEEKDGKLLGAASYRQTPDGVKLCNIAVTSLRCGIGTRLFNRVKAESSDGKLWCKAIQEAFRFYEAMGMKPFENLDDGRQIFRL